MDLTTNYLGFRLPHPFMPGASPLVDSLDMVKRLEDAGAAAIVMHSLFQEQHASPAPTHFTLDPDQYLEQLRKIRASVSVPVIASLNGTLADEWLEWAPAIEQAGADALELNIYYLAADPLESGEEVDRRVIRIARRVRGLVTIPIAIKLSMFHSGLAHLVNSLDVLGVNGVTLFNRFYQPDIDIETRTVVPSIRLSDSSELLVRLRWLAILSPQVRLDLAVSGGVHTTEDAVKSLMAGADAIQLVSSLLRNGPEHLAVLRQGLSRWLEDHGHGALSGIRGILDHHRCPNPADYERVNYTRALQGAPAPDRPGS